LANVTKGEDNSEAPARAAVCRNCLRFMVQLLVLCL
jgi:hypothetical protein